jgi:hypothetical protein
MFIWVVFLRYNYHILADWSIPTTVSSNYGSRVEDSIANTVESLFVPPESKLVDSYLSASDAATS